MRLAELWRLETAGVTVVSGPLGGSGVSLRPSVTSAPSSGSCALDCAPFGGSWVARALRRAGSHL